jgi:hypothetical protein
MLVGVSCNLKKQLKEEERKENAPLRNQKMESETNVFCQPLSSFFICFPPC